MVASARYAALTTSTGTEGKRYRAANGSASGFGGTLVVERIVHLEPRLGSIYFRLCAHAPPLVTMVLNISTWREKNIFSSVYFSRTISSTFVSAASFAVSSSKASASFFLS